MSNLQNLVEYFVASYPSVGRVTLMKMVYLFDYYHTLAYGAPFTSAQFIRYQYGPFASSVYNAVEMSPIITEIPYVSMYNRLAYSYKIAISHETEALGALPTQQHAIAEVVVDFVRNKTYDELIEYVYATPPMDKIRRVEEVDGQEYWGEVLDMTARKPIPKFSRAQIAAAQKRLRQREKRGSDEEYLADLLAEYHTFSKLRERANKCLALNK